MSGLPTGTITFLFVDIEGSTQLLQSLGERYPHVLAEYRQLLRSAIQRHGGREINAWGTPSLWCFTRLTTLWRQL